MSGRPREFKQNVVLDAAAEAFWSKGYEACSTQDLCDSTGLGRGSLYNAFGSKQALYEQVLQRYCDIGIEAQIAILEAPGPVLERLYALMVWCIDVDLDDPGRRGCLGVNAAVERGGKDPVVTRIVGHNFSMLEDALCRLLERGQRSGEITAKRTPLELARMFRSCYYGLRVIGKVEQKREPLMDVVDTTLALFAGHCLSEASDQ